MSSSNRRVHLSLILALIIGVIIFMPVLLIIIVTTPLFNPIFNNVICQTKEEAVYVSPSGENTAVVKTKNCGVTSGFDTWVELSSNNMKEKIFYNLDYPKDLKLRWKNDKQLLISYTNRFCPNLGLDDEETQQGMKGWNGIEITYKDNCPK